ncbi:MAG: carboxylate-amine ligase [Alphaproteobacteria bacterium]|nr:carboxylate-amine ligase [Alphaproteobacteria bacterium]
MPAKPAFTLGIEEEYLLVDRQTRALVAEQPPTMMAECEGLLRGQVEPEFLRCQIEVETRVCQTVAEARADLAHLRGTVATVAARHGLAIIAAATHPFARWREQHHTDSARFHTLARELEGVARRLVICGMHVHAGIADEDLRIDLMNQMRYFLPHLLALSTSSPFWEGEDSGLMFYRLSVFDSLPRTGLPERFESAGEFNRLVAHLVEVGVIPDGSKLWWDIRPSARFPTLEMRITDICTRLDDGVAIAALYQCLLHRLWRLRESNQRWRIYPNLLVEENRWRAQRYGLKGELIDFGKWRAVPYPELFAELLELVAEDAAILGCQAELAGARDILRRGTSAHAQRRVFADARAAGATPADALAAVVD